MGEPAFSRGQRHGHGMMLCVKLVGAPTTLLPCSCPLVSSSLARRLLQGLQHAVDVLDVRGGAFERGRTGVDERALAIDDKPARLVFYPDAPAQAFAGHAVSRRGGPRWVR